MSVAICIEGCFDGVRNGAKVEIEVQSAGLRRQDEIQAQLPSNQELSPRDLQALTPLLVSRNDVKKAALHVYDLVIVCEKGLVEEVLVMALGVERGRIDIQVPARRHVPDPDGVGPVHEAAYEPSLGGKNKTSE